MLSLRAKQKEIEITNSEYFVKGTVGALCQIVFDEFWANYNKTVVFKRVSNGCIEPYVVFVENMTAELTIPHEILSESGLFKIGVYGTAENQTLPTLWSSDIRIEYGTDTSGVAPKPPTPDVYSQILQTLSEKVNINQGVENAGKYLKVDVEGNVIPADDGGATDYNDLTNKPKINGTTLQGNVTLGASDVGALPDDTPIPIVDQVFDSSSANAQSGVAISGVLAGYVAEIEAKADKVSGATGGNFASLTSSGNLADSNYKPSDFAKENFYKKFLEYDIAGDNIIVNGSKKVNNYIPAEFIVPDYIDGRLVYAMSETFKNKTDIESVVLPENLQYISYETFKGCTGLTSVTIPEKVIYIGDSCFRDSTSLTTVYIPKSVTEIGYNVFDGCTALTTVLYEGSQADWQNITMSDSPTWLNLIVYDQEYVKKADLPSGITVDQTYNSASTNAQSGTAVSQAVSGKADKVASATNGNFAGLDSNGNLTDSGKSPSDIPTSLSALSDDSTHRLVTDTEKSTWNGKSDFSGNYNDLSNKPTIPTVDQSYNSSSTNAQSGVAVASAISGKEDSSNKVTSLTAQSTDTQYPTAKCVYDNLADKQNVIDNNNKLSYSYISGTPTIPTAVSQLSNDSGYLTLATLPIYSGGVV